MTEHLQQAFEATIFTHLYPRAQIDIFVEVSDEQLNWINILYGNFFMSTQPVLEMIIFVIM